MSERAMPDWMMDYVAAIDNPNSYVDYKNLSKSYYNEINKYHSEIYPQKKSFQDEYNPQFGLGNKPYDATRDLRSIDEKYKEKSLDIACKYGYEKPPAINTKTDADFTSKQQNSPEFGKVIKDEDKLPDNASHQDEVAQEAHKEYFKNHPQAKENFKLNKEQYREQEKFDIEMDKGHDFAKRYLDQLESSKKEKRGNKDLAPAKHKDPDLDKY